MKIKLNQEIKNIDGVTPLYNIENDPTSGIMFAKNVCINAILTPTQGDDEKIKFEKWEIFKKLRDCDDIVDLTIDQWGKIKSSIGKYYPQLILGQMFEILEGKNENI